MISLVTGMSSTQNIWQVLEQTLARVNNRLGQVENRLVQLENQQERPRTMFSERRVVEAAGLLGGRELLTSADNSITRVTHQPVCDICGRVLRIEDEEFSICRSCGKKLCRECGIKYSSALYCIACLRRQVPLEKASYKILVAVANCVTRASTIAELVKLPRKNVEDRLTELFNTNLIMKQGLSIFSRISVTAEGLEAIGVFRGAYGSDEDALQFDSELRRYLMTRG